MQNVGSEPASKAALQRRIHRQASPTEMIYIATGTIVVSRSSIAGAVSREQFDTAVGYVEACHGILRSVVEDGYFVERGDDAAAVAEWLSSDSCSAGALYAKLLNAELDTHASSIASTSSWRMKDSTSSCSAPMPLRTRHPW